MRAQQARQIDRPLSAEETSGMLGVSVRTVYTMAAPNGPLPCYRVGRRVVFDVSDIQEHMRKYQCTEIRRAVASSISSTTRSRAGESELESFFRQHGVKPRLKPSTGGKHLDGTRRQAAADVTPTR